ncbi:hypothetical protein B0J14DRAFT_565074 [Halenospora varia]|nr:hypothetical protein B0J14DRAFT_565074 [Halenospora varia]
MAKTMKGKKKIIAGPIECQLRVADENEAVHLIEVPDTLQTNPRILLDLPVKRHVELREGRVVPDVKYALYPFIIYRIGDIAKESCVSCLAGNGPFTKCVILPDWAEGGCQDMDMSDPEDRGRGTGEEEQKSKKR